MLKTVKGVCHLVLFETPCLLGISVSFVCVVITVLIAQGITLDR